MKAISANNKGNGLIRSPFFFDKGVNNSNTPIPWQEPWKDVAVMEKDTFGFMMPCQLSIILENEVWRMDNIMERILVKCGIDGKTLKLTKGRYSIYYRCPNYESSEREPGKKACMNRLSLKDAEILYAEIEKIEARGNANTGTGGTVGHLAYEIGEVNERYMVVYVINTSKINMNGGYYTWG